MARTQLKVQTERRSDIVQRDDRPALRAVPAADRADDAIALSSRADRSSIWREISVAVAVVLAAFGGLAYMAGLAVAVSAAAVLTVGLVAWGHWVLDNTVDI